MSAAAAVAVPQRRVDLDWIRIGAFALLILYHIGLFFSPWDWHVNSRHAQPWVNVTLVFTNPWRLMLLFLVSGAAVRFMSRRMSAGALLVDRSRRLLPPLLFGILFLVPPQAYLEATTKSGLAVGYLEYWAGLFSSGRGLADLPLNHLWFILYVWTYALVAAALLALPASLSRPGRAIGRLLRGPGVLIAPAVYLVLARVLLFPQFGVTNHLTTDWYNHAASLAAFLAGFWMAGDSRVWRDLDRFRWPALAAAVASDVVLALDASLPDAQQHGGAAWLMTAFAINQWCVIAAILGFGHRYLGKADGPLLRYLRQGVFPFYLVHQTIIVLVAVQLEMLDLPAPVEAGILIASTVAGCWLAYEIVRRTPPLRPLFGLPASGGQARAIADSSRP